MSARILFVVIMTDFQLSSPKPAVVVGWRVVTMKEGDDKYKNHPRKFQVLQAANEFANLLKKSGGFSKGEVREILKVYGI